MDALAPSTIVVAMEQLDTQLATLSERRQLLQQLLATYDDADGETVEPTWVHVERDPATVATDEQFAIVDAAPKTKPAPRAMRKWDYAAVADEVKKAPATMPVARHLAQTYDIPEKTGYHLIKRCRELGYLDDPKVSFVPTPIERTSFDAEAARDRSVLASVPKEGKGGGAAWQPAVRLTPSKPETPAPKFGVDDVLGALEAS